MIFCSCCIVSQIEDSGALGELSFREDGRRQGYVIGIYGLSTSGLIQVWRWLLSMRRLTV